VGAAPTEPTHLLYLHGFRSSPQSAKARQMAAWVETNAPQLHWWCPQLPPSPEAARRLIEDGTAAWPRGRMAVIGSSLGGFYATVLAEATGCRAVLLNPAVFPERDLARHIGEQQAYHAPEQRFFFEPRFIDELAAMRPATLTQPSRYAVIIAKGDELLSWREMAQRHQGAMLRVLEGGDHALSDFETQHLPFVLHWLGLPTDHGPEP
jgi:uncharacterized protein